MNPTRPPRLPAGFSPCTLTSRLNTDNSLVVEFTFPPNCPDATQFTTGIVDAAAVLANLFDQFSRQIEQQARNQRTDAVQAHWKERQREVQQVYFELRRSGIRHRAALDSMMKDRRFDDLVSTYRWSTAIFNATVKSFLGPVPLLKEKKRKSES